MLHLNWAEILLIVLGGISAFLVNLLWIEMVATLNQLRPEAEKLSYYSSTPWDIARRYEQAVPRSAKPWAVRICMAITFICFVLLILRIIIR
jgi:hypothetical protein